QRLEEVAVHCQVRWEFEADTQITKSYGGSARQEPHFDSLHAFNRGLEALKRQATHGLNYHEACMSSAMEESAEVFSKPGHRNLGRIGAISMCEDCDRCQGAKKFDCMACFSKGRVGCLRCRGTRTYEGVNC